MVILGLEDTDAQTWFRYFTFTYKRTISTVLKLLMMLGVLHADNRQLS